MGYCAKEMKMFWVSVDIPTKTCIMHTDDCIYTKRMRETKLKGVGVLKRDGGWLSFGTFLQTEDYCKREWEPRSYAIRKGICL